MAKPNGDRVQFEGRLVGRALNVHEQVTGVILGDLLIDGRRIYGFNALCTPARAFDQVGSFEKARITGNGELRRNAHGEIRLTDCRWIELADLASLPETATG